MNSKRSRFWKRSPSDSAAEPVQTSDTTWEQDQMSCKCPAVVILQSRKEICSPLSASVSALLDSIVFPLHFSEKPTLRLKINSMLVFFSLIHCICKYFSIYLRTIKAFLKTTIQLSYLKELTEERNQRVLESSIPAVTCPAQNPEVRCWQEYKLLQTFWKAIWQQIFKNLAHIAFDPAAAIRGI